MSEFNKRIASVVNDISNLLSTDFCSGFPYLKLSRTDYSVGSLESTHAAYADLLRTLAYENQWKSNKVSFFDIHPVFSSAQLIPGIMGFHLSLLIYQGGLASATESLYFDTRTNWLKISPMFDNKQFSVASWIKFKRNDLGVLSSDDNVNPDIYLPINVSLLKGVELASVNTQAPDVFDKNLLDWYESNNLLKSGDKHNQILVSEVEAFKISIESVLEKDGSKFESSACYLYALIFCREFGFSFEIFNDVISNLNLRFDFKSDLDIISYSQLCFYQLDQTKIKIGDYDKLQITLDQTDTSFDVQTPTKKIDAIPETHDELQNEANGIKPIVESIVSYHAQGQARFFEMKKALDSVEESRVEIIKIWTRLVQSFYRKKLTKENYNMLRNIMDMQIVEAINKFAVLKRNNYDIQYRVMQDTAYYLYINADATYKSLQEDDEHLVGDIYNKITPPPLTSEQSDSMNMMNTKAKAEYHQAIYDEHKDNFVRLLNKVKEQFGHTSKIAEHGGRFIGLSGKEFKDVILKWYIENYIQSYLEVNNNYHFIFRLIEEDQRRFSNDPYFQRSLFTEINTFVYTICNPFNIIDLAQSD